MLLCALLFAPLLALEAMAQKRVALIIGNAGYGEAAPLKNPANDAVALSAVLERLGFQVLTGLDLDLRGMRSIARDFSRELAGADIALFFYAGHGVQVNGKNYLLPVDAKLEEEADLDFAALEAEFIMRQMDRSANTKLVMLDACRNNPFEHALSRSMGATRSATALGRGLARINASGGSMIAFATDPGAVAFDGDGRHSPFTAALLEHIETPGLEVNVLMTRVRADVFAATDNKQRPWTSSSLIGEVYLAPTGSAAGPLADEQAAETSPAETSSSDTDLDIALWTSAEKGGTAADYQAYLAQFPEGAFAGMAANRLAALAPSGRVRDDAALSQQETSPDSVEAALGLDKAARREVQERLTIQGYDTKGLDGIFGPGSRRAITAWQAAEKRDATGYLTAEDIDHLTSQTDSKLAAFRAEQSRKAAERRERRQRQQTAPTSSGTSSSGLWTARASCGGITGSGRHADRQQAMLLAARQCASRGGAPGCCTSGVSVSR